MNELVINAAGLNSRQLRLVAILANYQLERDEHRRAYLTANRLSYHHNRYEMAGKVIADHRVHPTNLSYYICLEDKRALHTKHAIVREIIRHNKVREIRDFLYSSNATLRSLVNRGVVMPVFVGEQSVRWIQLNTISSQLVFIPIIPKCVLDWFMFENVIDYYLSPEPTNWDIATTIIKNAFGGLKKFTADYEENIGIDYLKSNEFIKSSWEAQVSEYRYQIERFQDKAYARLAFDENFPMDLKEFCESVSETAWLKIEETLLDNLSEDMLKKTPEEWNLNSQKK